MTTKALATLIEHAQEKYPHFESERGQADIQAAIAENTELIEVIHALRNALNDVNGEMNNPSIRKAFDKMGKISRYHTLQHNSFMALRSAEGL